MKIEVWSDIVCPFCYIGKRHLEIALQQLSLSHVTIEWKSFQLDPTITPDMEGTPTTEYLMQTKGIPANQIQPKLSRVEEMAKNAGLDYALQKNVVTNTRKCHQLLQWAKSQGKGAELKEKFLHAYFIQNKNLSALHELDQCLEETGLSLSLAHEALQNENWDSQVQHDIDEARRLGISGVPFFVFNEQFGLSGAQPVEKFVETIQHVLSVTKE